MVVALLAVAFVALWAGATLLLSCVPGLRQRRPLAERLAPYVDRDEKDWVDDVEFWLRRR